MERKKSGLPVHTEKRAVITEMSAVAMYAMLAAVAALAVEDNRMTRDI